VYSCDHFVSADYRIGSILACPWKPVCNGGCPKDRLSATEDGGPGDAEPGINYLCAGLKRFFSYAEKPLKKIAQLGMAGAQPEAIMTSLRRDLQERWRGVGRNDPCPCGSGRKAKHCCWNKRP
jgi:uncharacterized protein